MTATTGKSRSGRLVSFVLPVFDEESTLEDLHSRICSVMRDRADDYELLFVDDGSTDGSMAVLSELQRIDPRVRVIQLRRNFGKSAAYSAGFDNARGEIVITMDTDMQDDPAEIPLFLSKIDEGHDMVVGWKHEGKGPLGKSLPSKFFNRVVNFITGIPLHDFNCPFKAYRREVLQEIDVYGELHRYIPVLARSKGFTLTEVKISNLPRVAGKSKYGIERYMRGLLDLLTISFITRFARRPMHLLGAGGIVACIFGFGILGFFILAHFLYVLGLLTDSGWNLHDRPALNLGVLLVVVGVQFFSLGLLGELLITKSSAGLEGKAYSVKKMLGDVSEHEPAGEVQRGRSDDGPSSLAR